jgi:hypothetical protein
MPPLTLPLNFGERPCDRSLLAYLRPLLANGPRPADPSSLLWSAFLVWKDFGIARDDRRAVPLDASLRALSQPVAIIEQYCGWVGAPGRFVEAAIQAGFFLLSPVDATTAELILVDFFPANHSVARDVSNSKLGGISKGVNLARAKAADAADEQLEFFTRTGNSLLETYGKTELREAVMFIHQICNILRRPAPASKEWKETLTVKALDVLDKHIAADVAVAFKWLLSNRTSQEIPPRLDFILDRFPDFVAKGRKDFR